MIKSFCDWCEKEDAPHNMEFCRMFYSKEHQAGSVAKISLDLCDECVGGLSEGIQDVLCKAFPEQKYDPNPANPEIPGKS
jgi:hypothetical protein